MKSKLARLCLCIIAFSLLLACGEKASITRYPSNVDPTPEADGSDGNDVESAAPEEIAIPIIELKPEFVAMPWDGQHPDTDQWNTFAYEALESDGEALLNNTPNDITNFCPNYSNLNMEGRKMFWIGLIAAMAKFESSYNPDTAFTESFTDSSGRRVISRGLLQLSYESSRGYQCPISSGQQLHDPKINLLCTVKILNRWLDRDGYITRRVSGSWRGGARYWSVLRKTSTLGPIREMTKGMEVCQ